DPTPPGGGQALGGGVPGHPSGIRSQTSEKARPCARVAVPHAQPSVIACQSQTTVQGPVVPPHPGQPTVSAVHTPGAGLP
ncbi:hypothetical protein, partial [Streptomyces sp. SID6137]|uniref:hypothetical protein n=1 Tax=Streptomyces sp. SID6137 TaxID=2690319 RepID=UPI001F3F67FA